MLQTCVIGGAGFVGCHVVELLLEQGRDVTVIGRSQSPPPSLPGKVRYLSGDYGDRTFLKDALRDTDEIITLAHTTVPKTSFDDPVSDILGNLPASVTLFETAVSQRIEKMVFVSSGGTVYGSTGCLPIDEGCPTAPISPYGITKLAIEKYAFMYHAVHGLPVLCVRPGNAYGPGQKPFLGQGLVATVAASILTGREILSYGSEKVVRDYLHVRDMAAGIVAALERGRAGECYNIGSGIGRTTAEVIETVAVCGRGDGYGVSINEQPLRSFDVPANILDSGKLMLETAWKPIIGFEQGIEETWRWYAEGPGRSLLCS